MFLYFNIEHIFKDNETSEMYDIKLLQLPVNQDGDMIHANRMGL